MQPRSLPSFKEITSCPLPLADRVTPFIDAESLHSGGLIQETLDQYDSTLRFGPVSQTVPEISPAKWLATRLKTALELASHAQTTGRPVHVAAPASALHHGKSVDACSNAVEQVRACAQEICLVFEDAALASLPRASLAALARFHEAGFRVGIDARRSWLSLENPSVLLVSEAVWINTAHLECEDRLSGSVRQMADAGIQVIGWGASWSRSGQLVERGVSHLYRARTDA